MTNYAKVKAWAESMPRYPWPSICCASCPYVTSSDFGNTRASSNEQHWKEFETMRPRVGSWNILFEKVIEVRAGLFTSVGNIHGRDKATRFRRRTILCGPSMYLSPLKLSSTLTSYSSRANYSAVPAVNTMTLTYNVARSRHQKYRCLHPKIDGSAL